MTEWDEYSSLSAPEKCVLGGVREQELAALQRQIKTPRPNPRTNRVKLAIEDITDA